jgi:hypothetical protein
MRGPFCRRIRGPRTDCIADSSKNRPMAADRASAAIGVRRASWRRCRAAPESHQLGIPAKHVLWTARCMEWPRTGTNPANSHLPGNPSPNRRKCPRPAEPKNRGGSPRVCTVENDLRRPSTGRSLTRDDTGSLWSLATAHGPGGAVRGAVPGMGDPRCRPTRRARKRGSGRRRRVRRGTSFAPTCRAIEAHLVARGAAGEGHSPRWGRNSATEFGDGIRRPMCSGDGR